MSSAILASRLNIPLDFNSLVKYIDSDVLRENWHAHVNVKNYHGQWKVLPLRCQREFIDQHGILQSFAIESGDDWCNLPILDRWYALIHLFDELKCPIRSARLMCLNSGAHIKPHCDNGVGMDYGEARLHIPMTGSCDTRFKVAGELIPMREGEVWYINADLEHEVVNAGSEDRINIVIDCKVNDWLKREILSGSCCDKEPRKNN